MESASKFPFCKSLIPEYKMRCECCAVERFEKPFSSGMEAHNGLCSNDSVNLKMKM